MPADLAAALADLRAAEARYLELLSGGLDCTAWWPADPPVPGTAYAGTGCQLLRGHTGRHRHRITGSAVTVDW